MESTSNKKTKAAKKMKKTKKTKTKNIVPNTSKGFRTFPPEIREMIFQPCLEGEGNRPALLAALRGDRELYAEAICLFYKANNTFVLSNKNVNSFRDMSERALESIKKVKVLVLESSFEGRGGGWLTSPALSKVCSTLATCPNLHEITFEGGGTIIPSSLDRWHKELREFSKITRLCKIEVNFPFWRVLRKQEEVKNHLKLWDKVLNVKGVPNEKMMMWFDMPENSYWREVWAWEAKETFAIAKQKASGKRSKRR